MLTRTSRNLDEATKKIEKNLSLLNSIDNSNQTDVPTQVHRLLDVFLTHLSGQRRLCKVEKLLIKFTNLEVSSTVGALVNIPFFCRKDLSEDDEAAFPKALSQVIYPIFCAYQ